MSPAVSGCRGKIILGCKTINSQVEAGSYFLFGRLRRGSRPADPQGRSDESKICRVIVAIKVDGLILVRCPVFASHPTRLRLPSLALPTVITVPIRCSVTSAVHPRQQIIQDIIFPAVSFALSPSHSSKVILNFSLSPRPHMLPKFEQFFEYYVIYVQPSVFVAGF